MELLTAMAVFSALVGSLLLDVHLLHQLNRWYYRLVCRIPTQPVRLAALPEPGRPIRGESLVVGISSEGLQVRSTRKKHHVLLRVEADGTVRAGASVWMWLCLLVWLGVMGLMAAASLHHPLHHAALLLSGVVVTTGACWALLRSRTRAMVAATERVVAARLHEERLTEIG